MVAKEGRKEGRKVEVYKETSGSQIFQLLPPTQHVLSLPSSFPPVVVETGNNGEILYSWRLDNSHGMKGCVVYSNNVALM